jgi:hypothetical protein
MKPLKASSFLKHLPLVNVTACIPVNRMVKWLVGSVEEYAGGVRVMARWRCGADQSMRLLSAASVQLNTGMQNPYAL